VRQTLFISLGNCTSKMNIVASPGSPLSPTLSPHSKWESRKIEGDDSVPISLVSWSLTPLDFFFFPPNPFPIVDSLTSSLQISYSEGGFPSLSAPHFVPLKLFQFGVFASILCRNSPVFISFPIKPHFFEGNFSDFLDGPPFSFAYSMNFLSGSFFQPPNASAVPFVRRTVFRLPDSLVFLLRVLIRRCQSLLSPFLPCLCPPNFSLLFV